MKSIVHVKSFQYSIFNVLMVLISIEKEMHRAMFTSSDLMLLSCMLKLCGRVCRLPGCPGNVLDFFSVQELLNFDWEA